MPNMAQPDIARVTARTAVPQLSLLKILLTVFVVLLIISIISTPARPVSSRNYAGPYLFSWFLTVFFH